MVCQKCLFVFCLLEGNLSKSTNCRKCLKNLKISVDKEMAECYTQTRCDREQKCFSKSNKNILKKLLTKQNSYDIITKLSLKKRRKVL